MVLNGEKVGLECKVSVDGERLEHVPKFKYLGCVTDKAACRKKVVSGEGLLV